MRSRISREYGAPVEVTWAAGATQGTPAIDFGPSAMMDVHLPTGWDGTTINIYAAPSDDYSFGPKYTQAGTQLQIVTTAVTTVPPARNYCAPAELAGSGKVQLVRAASNATLATRAIVTVKG